MKFNNSFNNAQHELSIRRVVYSIQTFKIILKNVIIHWMVGLYNSL